MISKENPTDILLGLIYGEIPGWWMKYLGLVAERRKWRLIAEGLNEDTLESVREMIEAKALELKRAAEHCGELFWQAWHAFLDLFPTHRTLIISSDLPSPTECERLAGEVVAARDMIEEMMDKKRKRSAAKAAKEKLRRLHDPLWFATPLRNRFDPGDN